MTMSCQVGGDLNTYARLNCCSLRDGSRGLAQTLSGRDRPDYCPEGGLYGICAGGRPTSLRSEGSGMKINPSEGHPAMDYAEHERTYKLFLKLTVYLVVGVIVLMALLAIFVV